MYTSLCSDIEQYVEIWRQLYWLHVMWYQHPTAAFISASRCGDAIHWIQARPPYIPSYMPTGAME